MNPTFTIDIETNTIEFNLNGGARGLQGIQGIQGETGPQGERGLQGPTGAKGDKGDTGEAGYTPQKGIDYFTEEDIESLNIPNKTSDLTNDSGFITNEVNDLSNYYKKSETYTQTEVANAINTETTNRENADIGLQEQIDAITSSSDVRDIVGTYQDLQNYDTSTLGNDDIIKVLQDSTHNNSMAYYRWVITGSTGAWQYIGQEGPYYTKSEIDSTLQGYVEDSDLTNYVQNTDYASNDIGGVIRTGTYGTSTWQGKLVCASINYQTYSGVDTQYFISKGTLENVITGKDLTTKSYVDGLVGDINTALDTINGEVI